MLTPQLSNKQKLENRMSSLLTKIRVSNDKEKKKFNQTITFKMEKYISARRVYEAMNVKGVLNDSLC